MSRAHTKLVTVLETEDKQHVPGRELFGQPNRDLEARRVENAELKAANDGLKTDVEALRAEV